MKKIYKYLLVSIVVWSLISSCNKEISDDLVALYKVEFNETTIESFLNTAEATNFKILIEESIEAGDYQMKYDVTKGSGYYLVNSERVEEGVFVDLPAGSEFSIGYVSTTAGENNVTLTLQDSRNRQQDFFLIYSVTDNRFIFDITPEEATTYVGGILDFNINITAENSANYEISYVLDEENTGSGTVKVDGEVITPEDKQTITDSSEFEWQFEGVTLGTVDIIFAITNSLGVVVEQSVQIEVSDILVLQGDNPQIIQLNGIYEELGATVDDAYSLEINTDALLLDTPGEYQVVYTAVDVDNNAAVQAERTIIVNNPPTASFTPGSISGEAPFSVTFDNTSSEDSDGTIVKSEWNYGDGESDVDTTFPSINSITYNTPDEYTVTLTVTDDLGGVDTVTATITVTSSTPVVTGFNRSTGLLTAPAGAEISVAMQSGGNGNPGNAILSAGDIAFGTTCWGFSQDTQCLISIHDTNPAVDVMEFTFTMPASNEVFFTGSHNPVTTGNSGSQFVIRVDDVEVYNDVMTISEGVPSN
ncbi:hypothetical protein GCM10022393_40210 [Aquimarina addita]|uniref:PKD domain-containing protein n=1 Tax=Aquimarina addita TaxID=870485 RepID=A0ABP6UUY1_9FLAO